MVLKTYKSTWCGRLFETWHLKFDSSAQSRPSDSFATNSIEDTLWVDRYRPTCFTDLIGNDRVARETMIWVKQWDYCVFGKTKGKKRQRNVDENVDDEYQRPREKVRYRWCMSKFANSCTDFASVRTPRLGQDYPCSCCGTPCWLRYYGNQC